MHANEKRISERVIGCAFTVSNALGAGFLEIVYHNALAIELRRQAIPFESQKALAVYYRGAMVGEYIADFVVSDVLILEIKALSAFSRQHEAQLMNYMKACGLDTGLLLNFGTPRLGIRRMVASSDDANPI